MSSLYLTKTIYSVILCVLFILLAREYPFIPIQLSWISAMAIGVPSFLLTLEQNESVDGGGFLRHVLRIALPQALSMVVCLLTIQVLTPFWNSDPTMTYMFNLLVGGTVSFMVVIEVCRPMNWIRRTMTVILICLFALGIILFPGLLGFIRFSAGNASSPFHDLHGSGDFQSFHAAGASGLSAERLGCHEDPGPDRQREGINRLLCIC